MQSASLGLKQTYSVAGTIEKKFSKTPPLYYGLSATLALQCILLLELQELLTTDSFAGFSS